MKFTLSCFLLIAVSLLCQGQSRFDIVIDEIMPDPSPTVGLPSNEWLELKNRSQSAINLLNWRIADLSGQSGPLPGYLLKPDSFVIVCPVAALAVMSVFGPAISVTAFPSLDNDGETIYLRSPDNRIIHGLAYSGSWYRNELKKQGGWSLEMIDTREPCGASGNWKASAEPAGGTPGRINSADGINGDVTGPQLVKAYARDSITLALVFDEPLDSLTASTSPNYNIDGGMAILSSLPIAPLWDEVELKLDHALGAGIIYSITAKNIHDCDGNAIDDHSMIRTGLPEDAGEGDWIINEILFDPRPDGADYIEFYNNSKTILDASRLSIANRASSGVTGSIQLLSQTPSYVFPGDYLVVTEDKDALNRNYLVKNDAAVIPISSLPSYPDDEGDVITLNAQGRIVDEVNYNKNWHFKLLDNPEGVSLERVDPGGASQNSSNWHSAASTVGYGTPGYQNSQSRDLSFGTGSISVVPAVFSPDNDGRDDFTSIHYKMDESGYTANLTIFDAMGRPVRQLVRNNTLSNSGYWTWDGLSEEGHALLAGIYIIFTEIFNLEGKCKRFKNAVVKAI